MKAWRRRKVAKGKHPTAKLSAEKKAITTTEVKKTEGVQVCVAVKGKEQENTLEVWEKERGLGLHYPK